MTNLCFQVIPALQALKIIGGDNEFEKWMQQRYPDKNINEIFEGYRFSLNCCLNAFVDGVSNDLELEIENDFLLDCAISQWKPIHLLPNTCEKTVFLKNIKPLVKAIAKSSNYKEISNSICTFNDSVTSKFDTIVNVCISVSKEINIDKQTALNLLLIDFTHTFLVQINNNGPTANANNPLSVEWTKEELKNRYFEGYKYAIQFLLYKLLGEKKFNQTHLFNMHLADSWRKYKLVENAKSTDSIITGMNEDFNLDEQTNFDSYFYWITQEVVEPLTNQYKISVNSMDKYFIFSNSQYDKKKLFGDLLDSSKIKSIPQLSWEEKIEQLLYWYPFELNDVDKNGILGGLALFNTMLSGTVTLHKPSKSEFSKVLVAKFIHPHPDNKEKKDYSYGVLIDAKSAVDHYSSGWIIFINACCDYSGFSGMEHKVSEKLIANYWKKGKIELRELTIPLMELETFAKKHTLNHEQLNRLKQSNLIPDIIQKSKAYLFELFTYYLCTKYYNKEFTVEFSTDKKSTDGEKDVVLTNDHEVILIECKLNPQSYSMIEILTKLERKLQKYSQQRKTCQLWFWHELSPQNKVVIDKTKIFGDSIKTVTVSQPKGEKILRGIYLKQMREIMQDYTMNTLF